VTYITVTYITVFSLLFLLYGLNKSAL